MAPNTHTNSTIICSHSVRNIIGILLRTALNPWIAKPPDLEAEHSQCPRASYLLPHDILIP